MNKISVVVPSSGNLQNLKRLLSSLQRQTLGRSAFEVLLILNGVPPERQALLSGLRDSFDLNLQVIFLEKKGVNHARSYGLKYAKAPVLFFVDDDCEIEDLTFLQWHIDYHADHPDVLAVGGGYQLPPNSEFFDEFYNDVQMRWLYAGQNEGTSLFLLGGNFSVKSAMAHAHGLDFDGYITYGGSESDFFRQANLKKLVMKATELDLIHHTHESFTSLNRKIYKQGRGKAYTDQKYGDLQVAAESEGRSSGWRHSLLRGYFNYVFWFGYYRQNRSALRLILHIARDTWGKFHFIRTKLSEKLHISVSDKKKQGKRF